MADERVRHRPDLYRAGYAIRPGTGGFHTNPMGNEWFYKAADLGGSRGSGKNPDGANEDFSEILGQINRGDTIYVRGGVYANLTGPRVTDVTIIGAATYPRHDKVADTELAQVEKGGAALRTASGVTASPLLIVQGQGWRFSDLLVVPPSGAAGIQLLRTAETATQADASHCSFYRMRFITGSVGIQDSGGCSHILIDDCEFDAITSALTHITGAGIAAPNRWCIRDSYFDGNTNHIDLPLDQSRILRNIFTEGTVNIDLRGGLIGKNFVLENTFANTEADITESDGYFGHVDNNDVWRNFSSTTAAMTAAIPT